MKGEEGLSINTLRRVVHLGASDKLFISDDAIVVLAARRGGGVHDVRW